MTRPNIHEHTAAICKKLGLEPGLVRSMLVTPTKVEAEVFLANENGAKYLVGNEVATERHTFEVEA